MEKSKMTKSNPIPLVNWRDEERTAWAPKEGREAAIEAAVSTIKTIAWELDDIRKKIDMAVALLALGEKDCCCGRILSSMPEGGCRGKKA
jgi:hypothetical protein